jgi:hypothetical protein
LRDELELVLENREEGRLYPLLKKELARGREDWRWWEVRREVGRWEGGKVGRWEGGQVARKKNHARYILLPQRVSLSSMKWPTNHRILLFT